MKLRTLAARALLVAVLVGCGGAAQGDTRIIPKAGTGAGTSFTAGAGLNLSGSVLTNTAMFGPDAIVDLANASAGTVSGLELHSTLTTTAAGNEASDWTVSLLNGGAQFTALYLAPTGFVGIGTATTNSSAFAAGSRGVTIKSIGNTTAALELESANTGSSLMNLAEINVWNGGTKASRMIWDNLSSTTGANFTLSMQGTSVLVAQASALQLLIATTVQAALTVNGALTVGSTLVLGASSLAANGSVATTMTSVGPTGAHTTVQEWMLVKGTGGVNRWAPLY